MNLVWHFDFHTPAHVRVGEHCDFEGAGRSLAEAGVGGAIFFAKCHYGFSYYPTQCGTPHPRLAADVFGGLVHASRSHGVRAEAYVSFGIDGAGGEARPEWRRVYPDGSSDPAGWFINVCPFTSYVDDRVLPQIEELFRLYRPDGFWFDTMSALSPCHCPQCRMEFRRHAGAELPVSGEDPLQAVAGAWRHDRGFALVTRVANFIRDLTPDASVGFNQLGSLPYPEPMPDGVTVLTLDPETAGPQSVPFSLNAAYGSSAGQPCEIMPTIFHGGWGDWAPASPLRLETTALACWIRSATCIPGDRLHPEGRLTGETHAALRLVSAARSAWDACAPRGGAKLAPDIVVLHSPSLTNGPDRRDFAIGDPRSRLTPVNGMHRLLLDAGANFTVAAEWQLGRVLSGAGLLIVPEIPELDPGTERMLAAFAEGGGAVLFTGQLPSVAGRTISTGGVACRESLWQDHGYLPPVQPGGNEVLVRGPIRDAALNGAECVLSWIAAYDARPGSRYGWGIGPSSHEISGVPALTRQAVGRGAVWFLNAPIASDYARMGTWGQCAWWGGILNQIAPAPRARLVDSGGNLELVVWEEPHATWLYLLDHGNEQLVGEGRVWARSTRAPAARKFSLEIFREAASPRISPLRGSAAIEAAGPHCFVVNGDFHPPFGALRIDWDQPNRTS